MLPKLPLPSTSSKGKKKTESVTAYCFVFCHQKRRKQNYSILPHYEN